MADCGKTTVHPTPHDPFEHFYLHAHGRILQLDAWELTRFKFSDLLGAQ